MKIQVKGAKEHNLKNVDVSFGDGLTVVTGVSGSGKTSLVFDTLYHEARRRFQEVFSFGSPGSRLSPASVDSITDMGPAVAVGQNQLNRNPNSTLASASGLHPFIRLLYAHYGQRYCKNCGSRLSVLSEDEIVAKILQLSLQGPINVYAPLVRRAKGSHTTLLHYLSGDFGSQSILIDGQPWNKNKPDPTIPHDIEILTAHLDGQLSAGEARKSVQTVKALGANTVMLRGKSMEQSVSFAPECIGCGTWFLDLEPKHFRQSCPMCKGAGCVHCHTTGLHPEAAAVTWKDLTFNEIQHKSITEVHELFQNPDLPDTAHRLREEIARRLDTLTAVGLGYVTLDRPMPDLSRGESQRVRLAVVLTSRLEDILHVLDEPTIGQHPADVLNLLPVLKELAGPVVFVEHDRIAAAYAHRAIDIGPAAGNAGGQIIFNGTPSQLWKSDTPSGNYFSLRERVIVPVPRPPATKFLTIDGARKHNLRHIRVKIPMGRLTVVTGVSGSGKSTLVEDVLAASLAQKTPAGCDRISYPGNSRLKAVMVDQSPIGKNPRSTPATYTKLSDIIRDIYSKVTGYTSTHFSFNRPEGACPTCSGMGAVEIRMKYLPSTWITCTDCGGRRFKDQILEARITINNRLISIGDFYEFPVEEAVNLLENEEHHVQLAPKDYNNALNILNALRDIGLGYLPLGQPSPTLSGGEAQRVKLARYLSRKTLTGQVLLLDEPTTGLHPRDLNGLLEILNRLVNAGATVVVVEHNTDMIRAADWIIDLGPGAGPGGGEILFMEPPAKLPETETSLTARALLEEDNLLPPESTTEDLKPFEPSPVISIRGAKANNLKQVDVDFPKKKLTVVTGVSGSGKSSLVADVLEAEARRRFLETLSLYERQGQKEGPQAPADSVTGLGVCLTVTPDRKLYDRRSTVGTASEISHHLAVLFSFLGERTCLSCGAPMKRDNRTGKNSRWNCTGCGTRAPIASPGKFNPFNYAAACTTCQGIGSLQEPRPEKLIISPDKPLCRGAMYSPGFFPKGYLCKPGNGGYDVVQAFASRYAFDTVQTPWESIPGEVRRKFLFGDPEPLEVVFTNPGGKTTVSTVRFPGFYGWIRDWDMGGTYTDTVPCPACNGAKLRPPYLAVTLKDYNFHQLSILPLSRVLKILSGMGSPEDNLKSLDITMKRLIFLERVGLGYLDLSRVTATLSAGEAQRVKLAGLLGSGLTSLTVLLDEPTRGLHPCEVNALTGVLKELRDEGNTVLVVEHDLQMIREADHLIDVGPLAGTGGGTIVASGTPAEVAEQDTITGRWLRGKSGSDVRRNRRKPNKWLVIAGARENNLKGEPVEIPLGVLVGVCGVSGSGKSTLFIDTIGRALAPQKQTTSVAREPLQPGNHDRITGAPHRTLLVDQGKKGIQNPANFLEIQGPLDKQFFQCEDAKALGLDEADFKKRCTVCNGNGVNRQDMGFLPGIDTECETCDGTGRGPEVRDVILKGFTIKQLHRQTIEDVYRLFIDEEKIARPLKAAIDVGLGYLVLKQPGYSLSGGEAQRLKIARELCRKTNGETLYILDEPTVGQHQEDVHRLCRVLHRLVDEGNSVVVVEHHPMLLASCDWVLELGPCGGPEGGNVIAAGTPEIVSGLPTPTAAYIGEILETPDESRKPGE